eukprot:TRINITY_DN22713_c0_g1_i1.p1 TRINITY_DN22713_c0_g1~~TRINITY_DN22713_c0_g1_i1.p1  ORF type:complete len:948 (+),score=242.89 TRINITY_DN22713_c0_g1_i1:117-2960(+)
MPVASEQLQSLPALPDDPSIVEELTLACRSRLAGLPGGTVDEMALETVPDYVAGVVCTGCGILVPAAELAEDLKIFLEAEAAGFVKWLAAWARDKTAAPAAAQERAAQPPVSVPPASAPAAAPPTDGASPVGAGAGRRGGAPSKEPRASAERGSGQKPRSARQQQAKRQQPQPQQQQPQPQQQQPQPKQQQPQPKQQQPYQSLPLPAQQPLPLPMPQPLPVPAQVPKQIQAGKQPQRAGPQQGYEQPQRVVQAQQQQQGQPPARRRVLLRGSAGGGGEGRQNLRVCLAPKQQPQQPQEVSRSTPRLPSASTKAQMDLLRLQLREAELRKELACRSPTQRRSKGSKSSPQVDEVLRQAGARGSPLPRPPATADTPQASPPAKPPRRGTARAQCPIADLFRSPEPRRSASRGTQRAASEEVPEGPVPARTASPGSASRAPSASGSESDWDKTPPRRSRRSSRSSASTSSSSETETVQHRSEQKAQGDRKAADDRRDRRSAERREPPKSNPKSALFGTMLSNGDDDRVSRRRSGNEPEAHAPQHRSGDGGWVTRHPRGGRAGRGDAAPHEGEPEYPSDDDRGWRPRRGDHYPPSGRPRSPCGHGGAHGRGRAPQGEPTRRGRDGREGAHQSPTRARSPRWPPPRRNSRPLPALGKSDESWQRALRKAYIHTNQLQEKAASVVESMPWHDFLALLRSGLGPIRNVDGFVTIMARKLAQGIRLEIEAPEQPRPRFPELTAGSRAEAYPGELGPPPAGPRPRGHDDRVKDVPLGPVIVDDDDIRERDGKRPRIGDGPQLHLTAKVLRSTAESCALPAWKPAWKRFREEGAEGYSRDLRERLGSPAHGGWAARGPSRSRSRSGSPPPKRYRRAPSSASSGSRSSSAPPIRPERLGAPPGAPVDPATRKVPPSGAARDEVRSRILAHLRKKHSGADEASGDAEPAAHGDAESAAP